MGEEIKLKDEGNKLFCENKYGEAAVVYSKALALKSLQESEKLVFYKNRAACYLKLEKYNEAMIDCTKGMLIYI